MGKNPWKEVSVQKSYVGWTRVTNLSNLKFWPGTEAQLDLKRFLKFEHDMELILFDQAYDADGIFQDTLYKAAYEKSLVSKAVVAPRQPPRNTGRRQGVLTTVPK